MKETIYRMKPVTVRAHQMSLDWDPPQWLGEEIVNGNVWCQGGPTPYLTVRTPEGDQRCDVGDWVIKGSGPGNLAVCHGEIFHELYEEQATWQ